MNWTQAIGWLGSIIILTTWFALTFKIIKGYGIVYQLSIIGSSLTYGYMNWRLGATPGFVINVLFGFLAIGVLLRFLYKYFRSCYHVQPRKR